MNHLMNVYRPAHFGATGDFSEMAARALSTESEPKLAAAVAKQIAAAKFKQNLPDYRQAEDITLFYKNPADIFAASYKAAWWLAEAARTSQAVEVVGAGQARDVGYAVDLDEVAPGFAVFQHAQDGQCGK